jgi:AraC-like DNA-binding protein
VRVAALASAVPAGAQSMPFRSSALPSMLHPPQTVSISFVHGMLSGVRASGRPCEPFLAEAGIAPELLPQADARVTAQQYAKLFRALTEGLDDDFIGLLSRPLKRGSFALIARSTLGAPTLEVAIRRATRTFHLLQDDVVLEAVCRDDLAGVVMRFNGPAALQTVFLQEVLLRTTWRLMAWVVGGQLPVVRFDFAFGPPAHAGGYGKIFPALQQFDSERSAFWFDARRLNDAVRRDEAALRSFLADAQLHMLVPRRGSDAVSARVRAHLQFMQPAWSDLVATANALHVTVSTLQRRLALEGTSFQALKDELRRDTAIVRLSTSAVPLAELADELGFANSSAFQRAFKVWTGSAPGVYRRGGGA